MYSERYMLKSRSEASALEGGLYASELQSSREVGWKMLIQKICPKLAKSGRLYVIIAFVIVLAVLIILLGTCTLLRIFILDLLCSRYVVVILIIVESS